MSRQWVVISEAQADFVLVTELADRVLIEQVDWLEQGHLESSRAWINRENDEEAFNWAVISRKAREAGSRIRGAYGEGRISPDAHAARRAILYIRQRFPNVDAIILSRDLDDDAGRLAGLQQAIRSHSKGVSTVVAAADPKREAWVLCGFEPKDEDERSRLGECRKQLGNNPCEKSQKLTAKGKQDKHNAKRVLNFLTGGDWEREAACWQETALETLRQRGRENGLLDYLIEVEDALVPQLVGARSD